MTALSKLNRSAAIRHNLLKLAVGASVAILPGLPATAGDAVLRRLADSYAGSVVATGGAVGVGVAIVAGDSDAQFFTFGNAVQGSDATPAKRFTPNSLFRIGSVTKVFTTNLLGQRVFSKQLRLQQPLSDFRVQTGSLKPLTSQITLKELASFTGGIADFPALCKHHRAPGCLPVRFPTLKRYPVQHLVAFFRNAAPTNYQAAPPRPAKRLPVPYFYSNYSMALVGYLIAARRGARLDNRAVDSWFAAVKDDILDPLGMNSTFLSVPSSDNARQAAGYVQALGVPVVTNGAVSEIEVVSRGAAYASPPAVAVVGGGGSGATAVAVLNADKRIERIRVTRGGKGYIAPPVITFANGGGTSPPTAEAIVLGGKIAGVLIRGRGEGLRRAPDVTIRGGRMTGGQAARLQAEIANRELTFVRVIDPGSGYVEQLSMVIAAGSPTHFPITASAPSGFLSSTLRDMAIFARAALAERKGVGIDKITEGFKIAERPYVCVEGTPSLSNCPPGVGQGGLAWAIRPADVAAGMPAVISKDGGVPGFSTFVALMPARRLAVVVFVNSVAASQTPPPAPVIAMNILNALFYQQGTGSGATR